MYSWEGILIPLAFFALIAGIIWIRARVDQSRMARQAETQQQLLTKFQSGQELTEFLETESGQQFMRQFESRPRGMIMGSLAMGIVACFVALGFLFLGLTTREDELVYPGVITLALGIGLIAAALVSRRLSRKWQLDSEADGEGANT